MKNTFTKNHIRESIEILNKLDAKCIDNIVSTLAQIRSNSGRVFFLGVGGSAANASHAVNDFRKITNIECYAPTDNVSELTARTNDEGWDTIFSEWLKVSNFNSRDALFILSVGGGNLEKNISPNLVMALKLAKNINAKVLGIVGKDGGYTAKVSDTVLIIPIVNDNSITPHTESFQALVWHLIVSHPKLKINQTKWESA
jgi:D-sedoheptulose 7-phosphate isomerase